jgi:hypothetical protein
MRPVLAALLALLLVPAGAAAKNTNAPARVLWNSTPGQIRAGGSWDARVSLLQGPGGLYADNVRPVIVVMEAAGVAERRVPMTVDVPPNTFKATLRFPRAGRYQVALTGFDPRDPARVALAGPPLRIQPAASRASVAPALALGAGMSVLLLGAWRLSRRRAPAPLPPAP